MKKEKKKLGRPPKKRGLTLPEEVIEKPTDVVALKQEQVIAITAAEANQEVKKVNLMDLTDTEQMKAVFLAMPTGEDGKVIGSEDRPIDFAPIPDPAKK